MPSKIIRIPPTGWVGLRTTKRGDSSAYLQNGGWTRLRSKSVENKNGFDFVQRCETEADFKKIDWVWYCFRGLKGVAVWLPPNNERYNARISDERWGKRVDL
jgi:hypothetical protein